MTASDKTAATIATAEITRDCIAPSIVYFRTLIPGRYYNGFFNAGRRESVG